MAEVQNPALIPMRRAFDSVFPRDKIRQPPQPQRFHARAASIHERAQKILTDSSRVLLGVGDQEFYVVDNDVLNDRLAVYKTYYSVCPPMSNINPPANDRYEASRIREMRQRLYQGLREWQRELGGDHIRKMFAIALDKLVIDFVHWSYAGVYEEESEVVPHLQYWIDHVFTRHVLQVLDFLKSHEAPAALPQSAEVTSADIQRWHEMALTRLGALRVDELFDIVVDWPATASGIDDLRHFITNPATRSYTTSNFINVLSARLLHPGASTVEILQVYISIIRAFRRLDPRGVLLDRVARVIRRYLRERDDTVKVIVAGLLSDAVDADGNPIEPDPETLTELALELNRHDHDISKEDDGELDWDNMEWMPDPIDAAPDYRKSKNTDVIGSLISLFESKDVFVKELQSTLADRLLRSKADFDQEISVLEHLKIRFGDSALQQCEVMLRDVLDSKKVDSVIRQDQGLQPRVELAATVSAAAAATLEQALHAKILSRLFWPSLADQIFVIPSEIAAQQARYETGFEALKQSRKLTWLNSLGQVEVELELQDRTLKAEVLPWQAAVIHAFQSDSASPKLTVDQLAARLQMSRTLVLAALTFWSSQRILTHSISSPEEYTVLETLPLGPSSTQSHSQLPQESSTAAAAQAAAAASEAATAERASKMAMYAQFVTAMLTNQGAMPLPRIAMMLGIVVPGGFPFSNEELKEFLGQMCRERQLEVGHGGVYKVLPQ